MQEKETDNSAIIQTTVEAILKANKQDKSATDRVVLANGKKSVGFIIKSSDNLKSSSDSITSFNRRSMNVENAYDNEYLKFVSSAEIFIVVIWDRTTITERVN